MPSSHSSRKRRAGQERRNDVPDDASDSSNETLLSPSPAKSASTLSIALFGGLSESQSSGRNGILPISVVTIRNALDDPLCEDEINLALLESIEL